MPRPTKIAAWLRNIFDRNIKRKTALSRNLHQGEYHQEPANAGIPEKPTPDQGAPLNSFNPVDEPTFIWCLIGNIIEGSTRTTAGKTIKGTKHFSPNTKVYCLRAKWGDGYEKIKVIGRHRGSKRYICIVMPSKYITNWRLQKVYRPYILKVMKSQHGWTDSDYDKETILTMLKWLPERTIKSTNSINWKNIFLKLKNGGTVFITIYINPDEDYNIILQFEDNLFKMHSSIVEGNIYDGGEERNLEDVTCESFQEFTEIIQNKFPTIKEANIISTSYKRKKSNTGKR